MQGLDNDKVKHRPLFFCLNLFNKARNIDYCSQGSQGEQLQTHNL